MLFFHHQRQVLLHDASVLLPVTSPARPLVERPRLSRSAKTLFAQSVRVTTTRGRAVTANAYISMPIDAEAWGNVAIHSDPVILLGARPQSGGSPTSHALRHSKAVSISRRATQWGCLRTDLPSGCIVPSWRWMRDRSVYVRNALTHRPE